MTTPSSIALQRVVVRMLFDERFRAAVYADARRALADLPLDARAAGWLTRPDPRAWRTDPHRRARALTALFAEFPASSALAAAAHGGAGALDVFFSSPQFHDAVQAGTSLAGAWGGWLEHGARSAARVATARLESALARAARATTAATPLAAGHLALAHDRVLVSVAEGSVDLLAALRAALAPDPVAAIVQGRALGALPAFESSASAETVLAGRGRLEPLPEGVAALLRLAQEPVHRARLVEEARAHGAESDAEAAGIVDELVSDGLLVPAR